MGKPKTIHFLISFFKKLQAPPFTGRLPKIFLLTVLTIILSLFQNCGGFHTTSDQDIISSFCSENASDPLCSGTFASNTTCRFNGTDISSGSSVTAYLSSSVEFSKNCQSETRVCQGGVLQGSYSYSKCDVGLPAACLFDGKTIGHGQSTLAFLSSAPERGTPCRQETRNCINGELSGSYAYATCSETAFRACLFDGKTIPHGSSINAFVNSTVSFGQTCTPSERICVDGQLTGMGSFAICVVDGPRSCLFNGMTINHEQSVVGYPFSTVPYGQSCSGQSRTCQNGVLLGSGDFATCAVSAPRSCLLAGQTIASGQSVIAYQSSSVPYGQSCVKSERICTDGTLSGSGLFLNCATNAPASCAASGGIVIEHGASRVFYPIDSINGGVCSSFVVQRTCDNGFLSGNNAAVFNSCRELPPNHMPIHRHYNPNDGRHLFNNWGSVLVNPWQPEGLAFYLATHPFSGPFHPLYSNFRQVYLCWSPARNFYSFDPNCEGNPRQYQHYFQGGGPGNPGYISPAPEATSGMVHPLYEFRTSYDSLYTLDYNEGVGAGYSFIGILGYVARP